MSAVVINHLRRGFYLDSVALMRVSAKVAALPGVQEAALMIGSESNKQIMREAGLLAPAGAEADANDLVIGIIAVDQTHADAALAAACEVLDSGLSATAETSTWRPKVLASAMRELPAANLALISVPGEFAARQARQALRRGLNTMIFSDNVPVEQELELKREARENNLLVMGPDCGTALIGGVPLAFANAVPRGKVGVVAASGTGLQEFSVLLARAGSGLSHGIGVGGRDLSDAIGAISTLTAIDWLEQDAATEIIAVISKPPGQHAGQRVTERLARCAKPAVVCFIGDTAERQLAAGARPATTLLEAVELVTGKPTSERVETATPALHGRWLHGLYSGGTLCAEAQVVCRRVGLEVSSNAPIPAAVRVDANVAGSGHTLIDLGADEFTVGRPHPMIEPAVRNELLARTLANPEIAVVLLDLVLGYGAHPDPAGALGETLGAAAGNTVVVASVCGIEGDPQGYQLQLSRLRAAGVIVAPSNAAAAEFAARLVAAS